MIRLVLVLLRKSAKPPPPGFTPIQGGRKGGYHRDLGGGRWAYWYPHLEGTRTSPDGYRPHARMKGVCEIDPDHPAAEALRQRKAPTFWHSDAVPRDPPDVEALALTPPPAPAGPPVRLFLDELADAPHALVRAIEEAVARGASSLAILGSVETWHVEPPPTGWPDAAAVKRVLSHMGSHAHQEATREQKEQWEAAGSDLLAKEKASDPRTWRALFFQHWRGAWDLTGPHRDHRLSLRVERRGSVPAAQPDAGGVRAPSGGASGPGGSGGSGGGARPAKPLDVKSTVGSQTSLLPDPKLKKGRRLVLRLR